MKELSNMIKQLVTRGYRVTKARRRGHLHVRDKHDKLVTVIPSTSSRSYIPDAVMGDVRRFERNLASLFLAVHRGIIP